MGNSTVLDIKEIIKHQRNRYPVLLIDKIVELDPGKYAKGIKCFTYNEWFFPAHFDDDQFLFERTISDCIFPSDETTPTTDLRLVYR